LPQVYFPTIELLRKSVLKTAVKKYTDELNDAITMCKHQKLSTIIKKLEQISQRFSKIPQGQRKEMFSEAYQVEKRRHEEQERQQNLEIIRKNIAEIINNCINAVNAGCSMKVEGVLNEVHRCLEQLDLTSIDSSDPIASGIIDISEGVDSVVDELSVETKQVLEEIELSELEFSEKIIRILDEFINTYELLEPNFDPVLGNSVTFPRDENNLDEHRVLLTTFDLLEGLLRPLLDEGEYSENSYVIHAVSRVVDPIFNYYKWNLKRLWYNTLASCANSAEMFKLSHFYYRPDLQVLLMLDSDKWELVFTEISQDGFDTRFYELINEKVVDADEAKYLINELLQIPFIGIQVISNRVLVFGIDFYNNSFYCSFRICEYTIPLRVSDHQVVEDFLKSSLKVKCYLEKIVDNFVQIKDRIYHLPNMVGNERPGSSMSMSTTF
ncbi:41317_t:CDS:2, partial [Gigaspora margarita]